MKAFDQYAAYYDLLYAEKDYKGEAQYVDELLKKYGLQPNSQLLEIGCGTGKHGLHFTKQGHGFSGIDQSEAMIEAARERLPNNTEVRVADARDFHFEHKFQAIYSLFHVMSYLTTDTDIDQCMQLVSSHLEEGGIFLFDCWHAPAVKADPPIVRYKTMRGNGTEVHRIATPSFEEDRVQVAFKVWVHKENDPNGFKIEETHLMRPYSTEKLEKHLKSAGLELVHSEQWMTSQPLSEETWYATHIAKKV